MVALREVIQDRRFCCARFALWCLPRCEERGFIRIVNDHQPFSAFVLQPILHKGPFVAFSTIWCTNIAFIDDIIISFAETVGTACMDPKYGRLWPFRMNPVGKLYCYLGFADTSKPEECQSRLVGVPGQGEMIVQLLKDRLAVDEARVTRIRNHKEACLKMIL